MIWKRLYSTASVDQHGTLYQIRNLLHRTNVPKTPKSNVDACEEFFSFTVVGHVIAAAMKILDIESLDDEASSEFFTHRMASKVERREALQRISSRVVDRFVNFSFSKETMMSNTEDGVYSYGCELLSLGLFFLEYSDAIHEGDGNRVLRCWRYLLLIFIASRRINYSIEALNMLYQYHFLLPPKQAHQLIWERFINTKGHPGCNIPCDLHIEHLNRLLKDAIKGLGPNKTEKCIIRVGKALGTINPVLHQFDVSNGILTPSGHHAILSEEKDLILLVKELSQTISVFKICPGRKHRSFPTLLCSMLQHMKYADIIAWIITHIAKH